MKREAEMEPDMRKKDASEGEMSTRKGTKQERAKKPRKREKPLRIRGDFDDVLAIIVRDDDKTEGA